MSGGDWKAMFKGIQEGDFELVKYYLRVGVDPNYQHPEFKASPLIESIRFKHFDVTRLLLENGANPEIKEDDEGETPLGAAKKLKDEKVIELLNQYINQSN